MSAGDPTPVNAAVGGLTSEVVRAALGDIVLPAAEWSRPLGEAVEHLNVSGGRVSVRLVLQVSGTSDLLAIEALVIARLRSFGATAVEVEIRRPRPPAAAGPRVSRDVRATRVRLAAVRDVVAIGAGKGGVGTSTLAVNVALALAREGLRTGLLDADIYAPTLPTLMGIEGGAARARMTDDKRILPVEAHGLSLVSFGFFLGGGSPSIWSGPMVAKAVKQFARGVAWPGLDVLIVDVPAGAGDVPLSLAQAVQLSGAVIVTQPTRAAIAEARRAARMFTALEVPLFGVVENMTGPFGATTGRSASAELGIPFLGEMPFDAEIVREGDLGTPTVRARAASPAAERFDRVAQHIAERLGWRRVGPAARLYGAEAAKRAATNCSTTPHQDTRAD